MNPTVRVEWKSSLNGGVTMEGWLLQFNGDLAYVATMNGEINRVPYYTLKVIRYA